MKRLELADGSFNNHPSAETVSMVIGNLGKARGVRSAAGHA